MNKSKGKRPAIQQRAANSGRPIYPSPQPFAAETQSAHHRNKKAWLPIPSQGYPKLYPGNTERGLDLSSHLVSSHLISSPFTNRHPWGCFTGFWEWDRVWGGGNPDQARRVILRIKESKMPSYDRLYEAAVWAVPYCPHAWFAIFSLRLRTRR